MDCGIEAVCEVQSGVVYNSLFVGKQQRYSSFISRTIKVDFALWPRTRAKVVEGARPFLGMNVVLTVGGFRQDFEG